MEPLLGTLRSFSRKVGSDRACRGRKNEPLVSMVVRVDSPSRVNVTVTTPRPRHDGQTCIFGVTRLTERSYCVRQSTTDPCAHWLVRWARRQVAAPARRGGALSTVVYAAR